ncbi:MAG: hypothetical protein E7102_07435 [Prevotella ruminicola]|jgi:hypothetical protein|uniref:Outer membrane protein beta-barrel domain-containing protein n=1 Tax=Xylanibacter ruminicola TaxID=839 RepID=A0A928GHH8_XYLRU|nr:hypothetical protein [Xylanibacter ruminicola]
MKHNIHSLIILIAMMFAATGAQAQNADKIHAKDGLFNHLSIGLNTGLTGAGIDVAMPVHKIVTVRAGISGWNIGKINFKAINTASEITSMQMVEEDAIRRAQMVDKVELQVNPNFWNFYLLGEVHPFKNQPFYFSAGLFVGSQNFVHFRNTNEDALGFLYDANQKVEDYNRLYRTNYPPIGLKFGDYIFTADENGNIDVRMKTNAVKPYIGVGFGQHLAKTHRVSLAVDAGLLFWGTPKFVLNNGTEIDSSGRNSGITGALKWLKAWPNIQVRVAYKIF